MERTKTYDVTALGELLIDFTENGTSAQGNPILEANPGGAPCNVLAMLNKLGKKTAFIGKVGNDHFGRMLADEVKKSGTDVTNLVFDEQVHTTLAFVHTKPDGDRDFSFYRNPGADMMLKKEEVMEGLIKAAGSSISARFLLPMKVYGRRPGTQLRWQNKTACSSPLIRTFGNHCGIRWKMQSVRSRMGYPNVIF